MSTPDEQFLVPQRGSSITPLEHQEVLYVPPLPGRGPCFGRWSAAWALGSYACIARIDEVVTATGELQALGAERPIKARAPGVASQST